MNWSEITKMSPEEKIELLNKAKDAYYNSGEEILDSTMYDRLEAELGLENNNYVGSKAGNYDVKHSFIMGSLSKIQIKENKQGQINWEEAADVINSTLKKARGCKYFECTPKEDGCSFSAEFKNVNGKAKLITVATRGNGEYGTDIKHWFKPSLKTPYWSMINDAVTALCDQNSDDILCIRGEVLVPQSSFSEKYTESYVNPRAFTAGMLGIKYEDATAEKLEQGGDLHFVCYDYRLVKDGEFTELSWMNPNDSTYAMLKPYLNHIGELPDFYHVYPYNGHFTAEDLQQIYKDYDDYRRNKCDYALDGIVFKPECSARQYNDDRVRPVDCIAMKFMPMINMTTITDIIWAVKKTGEYFPTAILAPIKMDDGKTLTKASLHNYNYIVKNNVGIGSEVRISLAGDIIPYVYEIVNAVDCEDNMNLPADGTVVTDPKSGAMHYMKNFTDDDLQKQHFLSSCNVLNINTIGPAAAENIFDSLINQYPDLENIVDLMNEDGFQAIYDCMGNSKTVQNIVNNLKKFASQINLVDIIRSFCFKQCGHHAAEIAARIMSGLSYSAASIPAVSYEWAKNPNSREYYLVKAAMDNVGVDFMEDDSTQISDGQTLVILTGSPDVCSNFKTKAQFMQAHPEFKETTSFKECQLLITDDLESTSGKMQKAKKAGIPIKTYGDFANVNESKKFDFNNHIKYNALF